MGCAGVGSEVSKSGTSRFEFKEESGSAEFFRSASTAFISVAIGELGGCIRSWDGLSTRRRVCTLPSELFHELTLVLALFRSRRTFDFVSPQFFSSVDESTADSLSSFQVAFTGTTSSCLRFSS